MARGRIMLLDTCALLWLAEGGGQLSKSGIEQIELSPYVYISAITGFEISLKHRSGKLDLPAPPDEWFKIIIEHHKLSVIPLNLEICIASTRLPLIHNDPCDRFIIASAKLYNLPIVTSDEIFKEYGVNIIS